VQFTTAVGIDGVNGVNVTIYPNPTTTSTTIALSGISSEVSIAIVDMNGRTVRTDAMSCEGDCVKTIEVSGLAQGAYFIRVNGEGVNMVKKLVVK
ncbi:MAG: T9SS type A sorting domain-containing protein, partial [Bacteroidales bacterium]|nr:T9SS type A sorting domain-containing protein [Bacteroidales bacterium]